MRQILAAYPFWEPGRSAERLGQTVAAATLNCEPRPNVHGECGAPRKNTWCPWGQWCDEVSLHRGRADVDSLAPRDSERRRWDPDPTGVLRPRGWSSDGDADASPVEGDCGGRKAPGQGGSQSLGGEVRR